MSLRNWKFARKIWHFEANVRSFVVRRWNICNLWDPEIFKIKTTWTFQRFLRQIFELPKLRHFHVLFFSRTFLTLFFRCVRFFDVNLLLLLFFYVQWPWLDQRFNSVFSSWEIRLPQCIKTQVLCRSLNSTLNHSLHHVFTSEQQLMPCGKVSLLQISRVSFQGAHACWGRPDGAISWPPLSAACMWRVLTQIPLSSNACLDLRQPAPGWLDQREYLQASPMFSSALKRIEQVSASSALFFPFSKEMRAAG